MTTPLPLHLVNNKPNIPHVVCRYMMYEIHSINYDAYYCRPIMSSYYIWCAEKDGKDYK